MPQASPSCQTPLTVSATPALIRGVRLYGKFTKVEKQADRTLYVEGIASSGALGPEKKT